MLVMLGLFPVVGLVGLVAGATGGGPLPFLVVWFALFAGIPVFMLRSMLRGRGVLGFAVSDVGIHGAADREADVLPWADVERLTWERTNVAINDEHLVALVAWTAGGEVRVTSRSGRQRRFVRSVESSLRATGVVPPRLMAPGGGLPGATSMAPPGAGLPGPTSTPPPGTVIGDPFTDLPQASPRPLSPPAPPAPPNSAADAPHWPTGAPPEWPEPDRPAGDGSEQP
jgi:hypothetical protein